MQTFACYIVFESIVRFDDWKGLPIPSMSGKESTLMTMRTRLRTLPFDGLRALRGIAFTVIVVWLLFNPAIGQAFEAGWIADQRTGCRVWKARPLENASIKHTGPCVSGYATGKGIVEWFEAGRRVRRDEGEFVTGKLEGDVIVREYKADWTYEGEWRDDQPHGRGKIAHADGTLYTGDWWRGRPHGEGSMRWPNRNRYSGGWTHGIPNGPGTLRMEDSYREYTGVWVNGCFRQLEVKAWIGVTKKDCGFE